jgi:hypothetical protein
MTKKRTAQCAADLDPDIVVVVVVVAAAADDDDDDAQATET